MKKKKTSLLFFIGKLIFKFFFSCLYKCDIYGIENIPKSGGAIIAPNHISFFDPPLIGSIIKRKIFFMAKEKLFHVPILGYLIKRTNAFPIKKNDILSIKHSISLLRNGNLLLVFPEGTRKKNKNIHINKGIGMLSCNAQVPLIPVKIENTNNMLKLKKITVKFKKPINPPIIFYKKDYISLSKKVLYSIYEKKNKN
jgi:1-acyl-sn-glycerol-3-phosphate acyltransferase